MTHPPTILQLRSEEYLGHLTFLTFLNILGVNFAGEKFIGEKFSPGKSFRRGKFSSGKSDEISQICMEWNSFVGEKFRH